MNPKKREARTSMTPAKSLALGAALVMCIGSAAVPAAARSAECAAERPSAPWDATDEDRAQLKDQKVIAVTERATKKHPIRMELAHGAAAWPLVGDSTHHVMIQLKGAKRSYLLNVKSSWATPSVSDISLWLYGSGGQYLDESDTLDVPVVGEATAEIRGSNGGWGYEMLSIERFPCEVMTIASFAFMTAGENVLLEIWLEPITRRRT